MKAILCAGENWGIGKGGDLLFHIKSDMRFFRRETEGNIVIMGRKTLDSFPGGRPLKNRVNIVLTRDETFSREGAVCVHSVGEAVSEAARHEGEAYVIGGGEIYALFLDLCDVCLVTRVAASPDADVFFPDIDSLPEWRLAESGEELEEDGLRFRFAKYERIKNAAEV